MAVPLTGERITRLREARGWTQAELARMVGVGRRTIQNWENDWTVPRSSLGKLYEVFGIDDDQESIDPIREASDLTLLAELVRRAALRDGQRASNSN